MFNLGFKVEVPTIDFKKTNTSSSYSASASLNFSTTTTEGKFENQLQTIESQWNSTLTSLNDELWGVQQVKQEKEVTIKYERKAKNENEGKVKELEMTLDVLRKKYEILQKEESGKADLQNNLEEQVKATNEAIMQNIKDDMTTNEKINESKIIIEKLKGEIEQRKLQNGSDDKKIELLVSELNDYVRRLTVKQKEHIADLDDLRELQEKVEDLEEILAHDKEIAEKMDDELEMIQKDIDNKNDQIAFKESQISDKTKEIEETTCSGIEVQNEIAQLECDYEVKVLERENAGMELEMVRHECDTMDINIAALEELLNAKQNKIVELQDLLAQYDARYLKVQEFVEIKRSAKFELRESIQVQIKMIERLRAEDSQDDAEIEQLQKTIEQQKLTIEKWEAEEDKDEAETVELITKLNDLNANIASLTSVIEQLRREYLDVEAVYNSFDIKVQKETNIEEGMITLETYNKYKLYILDKDTIIKGMAHEAEDLQLTFLNNTKYSKELKAELDELRNKLKSIQNGYQTSETTIKDYEGKAIANSKLIDAQMMAPIVANLNVAKFRESVDTQTGDLIRIINQTINKLN